jgi:transketolase
MRLEFGPRRGDYINVEDVIKEKGNPLSDQELASFEAFDLIYRSLCAVMFNYVPMSGHPGGSVSSGRIVAGALFDIMDYDFGDPDRADADLISYAAGHKALGLYAMWALRNEVARIGAPDTLPADIRYQLRLEDLLGFRRNPVTDTPLFTKFKSKPLDGHPTPATPFLRLSTGASGVGLTASIGLALGARDYYGKNAPKVHIIEGEGGLTPGRVAEALAAAGTGCLENAILHLDWNQASIDSNKVCRDGNDPGDYVQWDPKELAYINDWNVIYAHDGHDFQQVIAAERAAAEMSNGQPTAVVYRTVKGWKYGIEGKASHGAGHKLCSQEFFDAMAPLLKKYDEKLPSCLDQNENRCNVPDSGGIVEECYWEALEMIRRCMERESAMIESMAGRLADSKSRLDKHGRKPRGGAPNVEAVYDAAKSIGDGRPAEFELEPGATATLRAELGKVLGYYNTKSGGAILAAAADLMGSTSVNLAAAGFQDGYFNASSNPEARLLSLGGICEDGMAGILSGLSAYGRHIGVASSYGAFIAALGHVSARLHAIGGHSRRAIVADEPYKPMILICAHAGLKTGEDGPTHADPQPLQMMQENFPARTAVALTPWDPAELWPTMTAALAQRPAVIVPFVTRPNETVPDREKLGLAPASDAAQGLYKLRAAKGKADGSVVLQGSEVALAFIEEALPLLEKDGIDLDVYYVASADLFDYLPEQKRKDIFPDSVAREAIGITGFTLPTIYRWVTSERGRAATIHPFKKGHFLGSGPGTRVLQEAGLDGESQYKAIVDYIKK